MKNNTSKTKDLLKQALVAAPQDFALGEVKTHIRLALQKLEQVEDKREKREQNYQRRKEVAANVGFNPHAVQYTLDKIEEMIDQEKKKLEEIHRRKTDNAEEGDNTLLG